MKPQEDKYQIDVQNEQCQNLNIVDNDQTQNIQPSIIKVGNFTFSLEDIIGKGSFSKVYRGHDQSNCIYFTQPLEKHQVAIKAIQKNRLIGDLKILIQSQIRILRVVNHPNIIKCYDIKEDENNYYMIMQLCDGGDLQSKIDKNGPMNQDQAANIIKDVFNGLLYLSQHNIIHRDIKVANIFLQNGVAKIADFGFAIHSKSKKQFQDISIGSPIYMSPQGIKHNVYGPTTDVWSFGIFIYQLLHGKTPYSHCTKQKQLKYNITNPIGWNNLKPNLSYSVKQLIYKCLEINYQKRITFQKLKLLDYFQQYDRKIFLFKDNKSEYLDKRLKTMDNKDNSLVIHSFYQKSLQNNRAKLHSARNLSNNINSPTRTKYIPQFSQNMINSTSKTMQPINRRLRSQPNQQDYINSYNKFIACIKKQSKNQQSPTKKQIQKIQQKRTNQNQLYIQQKSQKIRFKTQASDISPNKDQFSFFNNENISHYSKKQIINNGYSNKYGQNKYTAKYHMKQSVNNTNDQNSYYLQQLNKRIKTNMNQDTIKQTQHRNKIHLNFPQQNINCYLYIVHFSRLLYKLTCHMQQKLNLDTIKSNLHTFCLSLLEETLTKINNHISHIPINHQDKQDFTTIKQTLIKYLNQYKNQIISQKTNLKSQKHQNLISVNVKLQREMNAILSNQIKVNKPNIQIIKLLYLSWIYGQHFNGVFLKYFIRPQSRHWYLYNLVQVVKQIQNDIQLSNTISTLQSYLKIKRKQQLRELS